VPTLKGGEQTSSKVSVRLELKFLLYPWAPVTQASLPIRVFTGIFRPPGLELVASSKPSASRLSFDSRHHRVRRLLQAASAHAIPADASRA
jgi:hypothetical protein